MITSGEESRNRSNYSLKNVQIPTPVELQLIEYGIKVYYEYIDIGIVHGARGAHEAHVYRPSEWYARVLGDSKHRCLSYRPRPLLRYLSGAKVACYEFQQCCTPVTTTTQPTAMCYSPSTQCLLLILLAAFSAEAGLLRVPKIYNTVITSDANLEPSRAYPIVQPVLTVGVQPVVAAVEEPRGHSAYYPVAVGGLYPFLTGTNALYPSPVLYHPAYGAGRPVAPAAAAAAPVPPAAPTENTSASPAPQPQIPPMPVGDVLNNNHRLKNPEIPDVPPPPLPVSASKKT